MVRHAVDHDVGVDGEPRGLQVAVVRAVPLEVVNPVVVRERVLPVPAGQRRDPVAVLDEVRDRVPPMTSAVSVIPVLRRAAAKAWSKRKPGVFSRPAPRRG
jgi:non-ribosomal peptide synthetase component F